MLREDVQDELLRVGEIADRLKLSRRVVRRKLVTGEIPGAVRVGRSERAQLRLPASRLDAFIFERGPDASD